MRKRAPDRRTLEAQGAVRCGGARRTVQVYMPDELFAWVRGEASKAGRTIAGQFRHFAEAHRDAVPGATS